MSEEQPLPVDPTKSMATQSTQVLMIAHDAGWLTFRRPVYMDNEQHVRMLADELGNADIPDDRRGVYYLVWLTSRGRTRFPMLIPEGAVREFVLGVAAVIEGPAGVRKVLYRRGILP
jgi:hypothetical protein